MRAIATKTSSPDHSGSSVSRIMASSICGPHRIVSCPVISENLRGSVFSIHEDHSQYYLRNSDNIMDKQRSPFFVGAELTGLAWLHEALHSISNFQYLLLGGGLPMAFCN
jgi:hypothetical protein